MEIPFQLLCPTIYSSVITTPSCVCQHEFLACQLFILKYLNLTFGFHVKFYAGTVRLAGQMLNEKHVSPVDATMRYIPGGGTNDCP